MTVIKSDQIKEVILEQVADLWDVHGQEALNLIRQIDGQALTISFPVELDFSRTKPVLKVKISFSKKTSDEREVELEDPLQSSLDFLKEKVSSGDLVIKAGAVTIKSGAAA